MLGSSISDRPGSRTRSLLAGCVVSGRREHDNELSCSSRRPSAGDGDINVEAALKAPDHINSTLNPKLTDGIDMLYIVEFRRLDGRWIVRREGARRMTSTHPSRSAAEGAARARARRQRCDVVVMAADGVVERRYDHDKVPRNRSGVIRLPRAAQ